MTVSAGAPGKIILFGEHAVVYGRPAIAVPVTQVRATVVIQDRPAGLSIHAADLNRRYQYSDLDSSHPLAAIIRLSLSALGAAATPDASLTITSSIPPASGLGSGAAVSTAIVRALAKYYQRDLPAQTVSDLVFEVEKIHHGTPSGIDNTVIAFGQPVFFVRGQTLQTFEVPVAFRIVIADTGIASPTKVAVGDVRKGWEADPARYDALFDRCGEIAATARALIETGQPHALGRLMIENQAVLRHMGVSCDELDRLVQAAVNAGALGAKLSGGGRGGNMIALVTDETRAGVEQALLNAGAKRVFSTIVGGQLLANG